MKTTPAILKCFFLLISAVVVIHAAQLEDSISFEPFRSTASSISGWTEQKEQYRYFTTKDLYGIIDGGAAEHEKQGLKSGIGVSLTNGDKLLEIYFEDFGTASRAKGMVQVKKKSMTDLKRISQVNVMPAFYDGVLGGCIAYWAKSHYYIEMTLTGYDSPNSAVRDAVILINSLSPAISK
jgi:hypothetical protein